MRIETNDAERLVVDYINSLGSGLPTAYYNVPPDRPDAFAVVERTGGTVGLTPGMPRVDIDVWATSRRQAWELTSAVRYALEAMPGQVENVFGTSIESVYRNDDIDTGTPRYTLGVELSVMESETGFPEH